MRHAWSFLFALFSFGGMAAYSFAPGVAAEPSHPDGRIGSPITVQDGLGRQVTFHSEPRRIVSTVPSNTEILYDLGLKDKVIAVTSHCGKTCDVSGKTEIGGWAEPAIVKKIADLKPDLVLAFGGLQTPLAKEMEERDIPTFIFFPQTVSQTLDQILLVGKITGTSRRARSIVDRCRARMTELSKRFDDVPAQERPKCVRLMSTQAMVIGGTSFQSDFIEKAGAINVFGEIKEAYPVVSLKDVGQKDPDIIILNRDDQKKAVEWFLAQPGWRDLRAAKEGKVISMSCDYLCHPNTRIDKTIEMLSRRLYPDSSAVDD